MNDFLASHGPDRMVDRDGDPIRSYEHLGALVADQDYTIIIGTAVPSTGAWATGMWLPSFDRACFETMAFDAEGNILADARYMSVPAMEADFTRFVELVRNR